MVKINHMKMKIIKCIETNLFSDLPHAVYELKEYWGALVIRMILVSVTVTLQKKNTIVVGTFHFLFPSPFKDDRFMQGGGGGGVGFVLFKGRGKKKIERPV